MKINPVVVTEIASIINAKVIGNLEMMVTGFNEIHRVEPGDLTFVDVEKYYKKSLTSAATTILINKEVIPPTGKALIISDDPFRDYNRLTEYFQPRFSLEISEEPHIPTSTKIGKHVVFGKNVKIGENVEIGHNVVIGNHVEIGDGCKIYPNVTIGDYTNLGKEVCIYSGAVIGGEAFYYKKRSWGRERLLSKGRTILEDFVEIGCNTTIDRGVSGDTIIGEHTKIDNLVQIGHDTVIGKRCIIASQVGIAGVCTIEDDVILWGQAGVPSDVTIGKGAVLMAKSGAISSLAGGKTYFGMVAKEFKRSWREVACVQQLPEIVEQLNQQGLIDLSRKKDIEPTDN
ncbi:MAG: UDP-3-O-(3-hydroxymyristoyl)glucosamine N-acyltransferase [Bacteroidia bacterium]|nr:UDP-3-O-(3-hydroxymyristoyl)glucosamine N-acyltransferase [Bacteroidia bacterium]